MVAGTVFAIAACVPVAPASAATVEVKTVPAKIELSGSNRSTAMVLVTNASDEPVKALSIAPIAVGSSPAKATITPAVSGLRIPAGATRVFRLEIVPWRKGRPPSELLLLARFKTKGGISKAAISSAELTVPAPVDISSLASVEAKASLATLRSGQTEPVYLLVNNKSAQRLEVERVLVNHPDFIEFEELSTVKDLSVAPGETAVLTLEAKAKSRVKPGEHQLVFTLPSNVGGIDLDLVTTQTAKVGVAGEQELLTLFGIPSLLVLPGFLLLATASLLWRFRLRRKDWDGDAFPLPVKEAEFWVVAILASIVMVMVAKSIADIDLLGEYGLRDLIVLWCASMLIGLVLYLAAVEIRNRRRSSRVPTAQDDPCTLLRKLARQDLDVELPQIAYDTGAGSIHLFLAQPPSETRPSTWASPRIVFTWVGDVDVPLNERIQAQLDSSHDAAALADSLEEGVKGKLLAVSFEGGRAPALVAKEKIGISTPTVVVREE